MTSTRVERRTIISGATALTTAWVSANEIVNPNGPGYEGKGAIRGIRIRNFEPSGWYSSGFQQLRLIIDGVTIASGTMRIPYDPQHGQYLNLSQFVMGGDYHEDMLVPASGMHADVNQHVAPCDWCTARMLLNDQRVPFHRDFRLQGRWIWHSGHHRGFKVDVWYELKS